jgi:RNA-directed DNA polymerase
VDDFLLFAEDKAALWKWKEMIEARLARLRLTLHCEAHPRPVGEGFPFLGFVIYPHKRRLKRRKGIYYQRKLRALLASYALGEISLEIVNASVRGWVNHTCYANTVGLRKSVLGSVQIHSE